MGRESDQDLRRGLSLEVTQIDIKQLLQSQVDDLDHISTGIDDINTALTTLNAKDFATATKQDAQSILLGALLETAPASDTASSGLNGRLQRVAQRITSLITSVGTTNTWLSDIDGYVSSTMDVANSTRASESTQAAGNVLLGAVLETAPASDTASSGLNGRLQRIAQRLTSLIALLPTSLGQKAMADSLPVVIASDQSVLPVSGTLSVTGVALETTQSAGNTLLGAVTETAPATDTASSGLNGRLQRIAQRLTTLLAVFPTTIDTNSGNKSASTLRVVLATDQPNLTTALNISGNVTSNSANIATESTQSAGNTLLGAVTETAPATDTASSGLNGRLQRVAQRITSLIALLPTALGSAAASASLAVTQSTEDVARQGIITETAPASDTASSGLNGRLQRIAQRITSLIALLPTALGSTTASASLAVTQSTEDVARMGIITETAPASDTASSGVNGRLQRIAQRITSLIALFPTALGQSTMANSFRVVVASDQSNVPVTVSDLTVAATNITTQNLVPAGTATAASAVLSGTLNGQCTALVDVTGVYTGALSLQVQVLSQWITVGGTPFLNVNTGALSATIPSAATGIWQIEIAACLQYRITALAAVTGTAAVALRSSVAATLVALDTSLPAGTAVIGALSANQSVNVAQINGVATAMSAGTDSTGTQRVTHSSGATATLANQTDQATNVTLLAASTSRLGATFFNDSTVSLYLKFGATASTTSFTVIIPAQGYYELPGPHIYNGIIDGIWASDASGSVRITSW